jgi:hypothetical protein
LKLTTPKGSFPVRVPQALAPGNSDWFEHDLKWYIEDYVVSDPFSSGRAQKVTEELALYGQELIRMLTNSKNDVPRG